MNKNNQRAGRWRLSFEQLESRQMLAASPIDPSQLVIGGEAGVVQTLGVNALAATVVPSSNPPIAAMTSAIPWMLAQGVIASLGEAQGGIVVSGPPLSAGELGSLTALARASHSTIDELERSGRDDAGERTTQSDSSDAMDEYEDLAARVDWRRVAARVAAIPAAAADFYFATRN